MQAFFKRHYELLLSFFLPILIMLTFYIASHVFPFGNETLLTVDLGQQYIDFFAYFRTTLLGNPENIIYSFSKAIGGDMIGVWAYYLTSPFNLFFIFFTGKWITVGVLFITLLKYGCAGLAMGFLLKSRNYLTGLYIPAFALSYALMGFMVANQLNIMWLDAIVFLPLVIYGLEQLMQTGKMTTYSLWLAILLFTNYYMGYMVCLFLILFFIWSSVHYFSTFKNWLRQTVRFAGASLLGGGMSALLLLPTAKALMNSKAQYTVTTINWKLEYPPFEMISKLFSGAFNFEQMPDGYPNIFVGSLALISFLLYLMNGKIALKERIVALLITAFLVLSMSFEPLDLLWHGLQFPIWYPYRFSFVFCFWLIYLGAINFKKTTEPIKIYQLIILLGLLLSSVLYLALQKTTKFDFLETPQLFLTGGLTLIVIALYFWYHPKIWLFSFAILSLSCFDLAFNAIISLDRISYVSQSDFDSYQAELKTITDKAKAYDSGFYRMEKTFIRTKNDAFQANYNSASHFSSTFESSIPDFMGAIGQPAGNGFITYSNGTLLSDALLGIKYFISAKPGVQLAQNAINQTNQSSLEPNLKALTVKPDLSNYEAVREDPLTSLEKNPYALPLAFGASDNLMTTKQTVTSNPLENQTNWVKNLLGNEDDYLAQNLFLPIPFSKITSQNIKSTSIIQNSTFQKKEVTKEGSVSYEFNVPTNDSYYLTLGTNLSDDQVTFYLNGKELTQYATFRDTVVVNLAANQKGQRITLKAELKDNTLWMQDFQLYQFNQSRFEAIIKKLKTEPLKITKHNNALIKGTIKIKANNHILATTIPYNKGWTAYVDGQKVKTVETNKALLAFKLKKGSHQITLRYWPQYLTLGLLISAGSIIFWLALIYWDRQHQKRQHAFKYKLLK